MKKLSLTIITMAVCLTVNGQQIGQQQTIMGTVPLIIFLQKFW